MPVFLTLMTCGQKRHFCPQHEQQKECTSKNVLVFKEKSRKIKNKGCIYMFYCDIIKIYNC